MSRKMNYLSLMFISIIIVANATRERSGSQALDDYPLIDGHNDLAYNIYKKLNNQIQNFYLDSDLSNDTVFGQNCKTCHTDLVRIKRGKLGAQFWSAYVECNSQDIVGQSLEQIDVIKRIIDRYPSDMEFVTTADGIVDAFLRKRLGSLIGVEGGHSIDNKMALLRQFYDLGVRYLTLTHTCNLPWADSSLVDVDSDSPKVNLSDFGKKIVLEMNRLGMMVDLSHVSHGVMLDAISVSKAPVIFSHSSAYSIFPHHRNVQDDVLLKLRDNRGIVMVNFYSKFLGSGKVTLEDVEKHINHIVNIAGIDCVGIGSDYDGVESLPEGLEDVSKYPNLFDYLHNSNPNRWTIENLQKLAGKNLYRVFKEVEEVKKYFGTVKPDESLISKEELSRAGGQLLKIYFSLLFTAIFITRGF